MTKKITPPKKAPRKKTKTPRTGRPKIIIDWELVENMASIMCTSEEIATVTGISEDTYLRRCKTKYKQTFADYIKSKHGAGRVSLRRAQFNSAIGVEPYVKRDENGENPIIIEGEKPNVTMQIWLGKNLLGQKDAQSLEIKPIISREETLAFMNRTVTGGKK